MATITYTTETETTNNYANITEALDALPALVAANPTVTTFVLVAGSETWLFQKQ
jgi:ribonuclease HI